MTDHSPGVAAAAAALDEVLAARQAADQRLEEGWTGTVLVEPLTALAGGILGGALVALVAIKVGGRSLARRTPFYR